MGSIRCNDFLKKKLHSIHDIYSIYKTRERDKTREERQRAVVLDQARGKTRDGLNIGLIRENDDSVSTQRTDAVGQETPSSSSSRSRGTREMYVRNTRSRCVPVAANFLRVGATLQCFLFIYFPSATTSPRENAAGFKAPDTGETRWEPRCLDIVYCLVRARSRRPP